MDNGVYKRVLFMATGALLSTLSTQQGESIPCIAHAIVIERDENYENVKRVSKGNKQTPQKP